MFFKKQPKKDAEAASRREHPRLPARYLVKISKPDGSSAEKVSNIFDLSEGGLRLVCHEQFHIGSELSIQLHVPDRDLTVSMKGRIVWIKAMKGQKDAWFAGVQFTNLMDQDRRLLKELSGGDA